MPALKRKKRSKKRVSKRKTKTSLQKKLLLQAKKGMQIFKMDAVLKKNFKKNLQKQFKDFNSQLTYLLPVFIFAVFIFFYKTSSKTQITMDSAQLYQNFEISKSLSMGDRIDYWSNNLYSKPDMLKVLGKGPEVNDTAPLFPHAYDCTTFVETVGALSRSKDSSEIAQKLVEIRYRDGDVSYINRNHFPEADWIPNNEKAGVLKDITLSVARDSGFIASFVNKDINRTAWFKAQRVEHYYRSVAATSDKGNDIATVKLPYIPLDRALEVVNHIPNGAVINVVRENKNSQPVLITHQGFLIWKNGVAYLRHASRNKKITEVPFKKYLGETQNMPWKVIGINVNEFRS